MAKGIWANIYKQRKMIAEGSGGKMSKPGTKGAPTEKTLKKIRKGKICYK